jgi:polar amino acid transport system substrate-binding protein
MKKWMLVVLSVVLALGVVGCGAASNDTSGDSTLEKAKKAGVIKVGFANEKPYSYQDEDGNLTGEAVEIARAVLKDLGIEKMEGELVDFGALITGLNAGRFDMITAGMYVNPDRCEKAIFAEPEYKMGEALAVVKGNPKDLHSYEDVAETGAKIAVMAGAIEIKYLEDAGASKDQILEVKDQPAAISALQTGQVDGITMTAASLGSMLISAKDDTIVRVEDFEQPKVDGEVQWGYGAAVFRTEDTAFRDAFNVELKKIKESDEWLAIMEPHGFSMTEHPGDITTAQLCTP